MNHQHLTAADIMQTNVKTVPLTMTLPDLEQAFLRDKVSGFPVLDQGNLVGVVSRSDIIAQLCTERTVAAHVSDFHFDERGFYEIPMESMQQMADRIGERIESLTVEQVMSKTPFTVRHDSPLREVADQFVKQGVHRLPVTDGGVLVGLITTIDLARLIAEGRYVSKSHASGYE